MQNNIVSLATMTAHTHLPLSSSVTPAVSAQEFKDAMAKLAFSVCVVTARQGEEQLGRTVTSFLPLSAEFSQIVVSIDVRSRIIDLIGTCKKFSVSFLSEDQSGVADIFAGKGNQENRFSIDHWDYWPSGNPKLVNAVLAMDCELVGSIDIGDHMLFVGVVTETALDAGQLLLWMDRTYHAPFRKNASE